MKRYKIFKRTTSHWNSQTNSCDVYSDYFLKYPVTLFGIVLWWTTFCYVEYGMGEQWRVAIATRVAIYEKDEATLLNRWNCEQNKKVIEELKT